MHFNAKPDDTFNIKKINYSERSTRRSFIIKPHSLLPSLQEKKKKKKKKHKRVSTTNENQMVRVAKNKNKNKDEKKKRKERL